MAAETGGAQHDARFAAFNPAFLGRARRSRTTIISLVILSIILLTSAWGFSTPERRARTSELWHKGIDRWQSKSPEEMTWLRNSLEHGRFIKPPKTRENDVRDTFETFYRLPACYINSLDLHDPFHPLCDSQEKLMAAMTDGGRSGLDTPYTPRGCDMRWFSPEETCDILSRFDKIHVIGDSMMRNLAVALHTLLRKNLIYGPRSQWVGDPEGYDCTCAGAFSFGHCIWASAFSSAAIWENDPESMSCPENNVAKVEFNPQLRWPLEDGVPSMAEALPEKKPKKPQVFLYGHGIWNNLTVESTQRWTDQLVNSTVTKNPWLAEPGAVFPKLFITPTAAGDLKPVAFLETQGNEALKRFERGIRPWVASWGAQHLGTYNATIQSTSPDGTHAGMKANLLKAMMVLNWMNTIDVSRYKAD